MPANLPPEAKAKWAAAQDARNPRERIQLFEEFLSAIPKHKGNERLRAQTKTKIADLRKEITAQRSRKSVGKSPWTVQREGAAQVVLFGPTNSGRSSLLAVLTNARPAIETYPYTTQVPNLGMLRFEDVQLQLVELPAPLYGPKGEYVVQPESIDLIRNADGLALVVDLTANPIQQLKTLKDSLEEMHVSVQRPTSRVEIVREKGSGEIRLAAYNAKLSSTPEQVRGLLQSYGLKNALVRVYGEATIEDIEDAILENVTAYKPTILIANKCDTPGGRAMVESVMKFSGGMPIIVASCLTSEGTRLIAPSVFSSLGLIRVYTKEPNEPRPSEHPYVVSAGTTIGELARNIHTDLANRYRYSRIWGPTSKYAGERVGPDHVLGDRDIVEIHAD